MKHIHRTMLLILIILLSTACSTSNDKQDAAAKAVANYLTALNAKNLDSMLQYSCSAYEETANLEVNAFAGVETKLEGLECQTIATEEESTIVACGGKIIATYGNENQELGLDTRNYLAIQEDGEWRMCGYSQKQIQP